MFRNGISIGEKQRLLETSPTELLQRLMDDESKVWRCDQRMVKRELWRRQRLQDVAEAQVS